MISNEVSKALQLAAVIIIALGALVLLNGCGSAGAAGGATIIMQPAPDGTTCYVVYQNSEVRGMSCK